MIEVETLTATVYRSKVGRRRRFTRKAAYTDAAWQAWKEKYPIAYLGCDDGYVVEHSRTREYRQKVIARLARWLMWRDSRKEAK